MKKKVSIFLVFVLTMLTLVGGINPKGVKALENDDFVIGTKNLNKTPENSAEIKSILKEPEIGWKRYDDRNSNITYFSNINEDFIKFSVHPSRYNGTLTECRYSFTSPGTSYIKFNFTGDKLRLIGESQGSAYGADFIIDGKKTRVSYQNPTGLISDRYKSLIFEVRDLDNGEHSVVIETKDHGFYLNADAIDIDEEGELRPFQEIENVATESISLDKTSINLLEGSSEKLTATVLPDNATNKKVVWTSSNNDIATVDENGNVTAVKEGQATIMAKVEGTNVSASCDVTVKSIDNAEEITVESEESKLRVGQEFTTDIVLHNGTNICAEDIKIEYDKKLFEYIGYEDVDGLKVVKELNDKEVGSLRFIISSLGKNNAINEKKTILKLKFKVKEAGTGKVDVTKARIADNGTIEKDILEEKCGEKEFTIVGDVNRDGEFTLLDLGIDAWYYGDKEEDTDTSKYDADVIIDGKIDDKDLLEIVDQLIKNSNYIPNN